MVYKNIIFILQASRFTPRFERIEFDYKRDKYIKNMEVRVTKYNRTSYIIQGRGSILIPFSDDFNLRYEIYGMQGNEYRKIYPDFIEKKMCTFLQKSKLMYHTLVGPHSNLPPQAEGMCPWEPKEYWIKDYLANTGSIQMVPFGLKMIKIMFYYYHLEDLEVSGSIYVQIEHNLT